MKPFPFYHQQDMMGCGPTCLRMIAMYHYDRDYGVDFIQKIADLNQDGVTMLGLSEAAERIGFKTLGVKITLQKLTDDAPLPCILHWNKHHFVVLYRIDSTPARQLYFIADPALGLYTLDETNFALHWFADAADDRPGLALEGIALLLEKSTPVFSL